MVAILIIVVAGLIAVGSVLAYQYYWQVSEEKVETTIGETPVDETADWKIYKNEKYGYEVKYPDVYELEYSPVYDATGKKQKGDANSITIGNEVVPVYAIHVIEVNEANTSSLKNLKLFIEKSFKEEISGFGVPTPEILWKDVIIDGISGIEIIYQAIAGGDGIIHETNIVKNGKLYKISNTSYCCESYEVYYKILSTFKFID